MPTITATTSTPCPCCNCKSTPLLCRTKGGVAEMCGEAEFTTPSSPPKKFRRKETSGTMNLGEFSTADCNPNGCLPLYGTSVSVSITGYYDAFGSYRDGSFSYTLTPILYLGSNRWRYQLTSFTVSANCFGSPLGVYGVIVDTHPGTGDTAWVTLSSVGQTVDLYACPDVSWYYNSFIRAYCGGNITISPPGTTGMFKAPPPGTIADCIRDDWSIVDGYNAASCAFSQANTSQRHTGESTFPLSGGTLDPSGPSLTAFAGLIETTTPTPTSRVVTGTGVCVGGKKATGTRTETLTEEDTEQDAIDRLLAASSWSEWREPSYLCTQPSCCLAKYQDRDGFTIDYQDCQWKVVRTGLTPSTSYIVKVQIWRREYGVGTFVLYATLEETVMTDGAGNLEKIGDVPNDLGYESYAHSACVLIPT